MSAFRDKIVAPGPVICYEVIPPAQDAKSSMLSAYVECTAELVVSASLSIDALNLPEIRAARREAQRTHPHEPKTDQRQFALQFKRALHNTVDVVVNRCTVYDAWSDQQHWLDETKDRFNIENVILVGGETSTIRYPGPAVTDMARSIHYVYGTSFFCGGITIPTRRSADPNKDEAHRLVEKSRHGLNFFTSQVLYEAQSVQRLLLDYDRLCRRLELKPKRIFLSFAPLSSRKDLEFLRWLGVEVPRDVENTLMKANIGIGWRSLKTVRQILLNILAFVKAEGIDVPLGLNVEHITRHNFELSKEFIEQLGKPYHDFHAL